MPQNTGVKNRINYFERLVKEDAKFAVNDEKYGEYLKSLGTLVGLTNQIYDENDGKLNKDNYETLVRQYLDVMQKSIDYKEKSTDKTRMSIVNYIQKVISKDLKALNDLDKEKPGNIKNIFETSRTMKVVVSSDMTHRVGGQLSDRFPIKNGDKKGFFTARIDTAQDEKWKKVLNSVKELKLPKEYQEMFDELEHDHELRESIYDVVLSKRYENESDRRKDLAKKLDLFDDDERHKYHTIEDDQKLVDALNIILKDTQKLLVPYHMKDRLTLDPYTRNDNKNAAMYEVAKFLKCERLIAKAVPMVIVNGDKVIKGTFMEKADGVDLNDMGPQSRLWKYKADESPYHKQLYRDLADMQLLDYICGNIDRHKANMFYKTEKVDDGKVKIIGLVGIDNDASFPEGAIRDREFEGFNVRGYHVHARIIRPENFRYVTKNTAEIVKNMSRSQLETILRGRNLSQKAIDLAWERTQDVQRVLNEPEKYNIKYADDLTEDVTRDVTDKSNPFYDDPSHKKDSIFSAFDQQMEEQVGYSYDIAVREQNIRLNKDEKNRQLDKKEYRKYIDQKRSPEKIANYEDASGEMALVANEIKIQRLETVMKKINRLKFASREFAKMRTAVKNLVECSNEIRNKVKEATELEKDDYKKYEDCLKKLNEATDHYIQEKGIVQKTGKGRERMEGARKILNIAEEISRSFAAEKHMEETEKEVLNDNQEMERV